jgi:hypothetical protein
VSFQVWGFMCEPISEMNEEAVDRLLSKRCSDVLEAFDEAEQRSKALADTAKASAGRL